MRLLKTVNIYFMPKFFKFFLILFLASIAAVYAQSSGSISGQIKMVDGQPFSSASINRPLQMKKDTIPLKMFQTDLTASESRF